MREDLKKGMEGRKKAELGEVQKDRRRLMSLSLNLPIWLEAKASRPKEERDSDHRLYT